MLQHVSFTEHLFRVHCCLPSLETENKDPFSSLHPGYVRGEVFYVLPVLAGWGFS